MKRCLVTGGSGFVGANLVRRLIAAEYETHVLLRPEHQLWRLRDITGLVRMHSVDLSDGDSNGDDELLLGADDILTSPVGAPPIAPPENEDDAAQPTANGGTLFERMSNIARGAPKAQIDEEESTYRREPIDIPRFLNRQNNQ